MTFNITSLAIDETGFVHLKHPVTDELLYADEAQEKPVGIKMYSVGSKKYRAITTAMQNRALKRQASKKEKPTAEELRAEGIDMLASLCISGENFDYNGMSLDNKEAFRAMLEDDSMSWIKSTLDEFVGDLSNFIKA